MEESSVARVKNSVVPTVERAAAGVNSTTVARVETSRDGDRGVGQGHFKVTI